MVFQTLFAGGIVLIAMGINATNSFGPDVARFFPRSGPGNALWMLVGGVLAAVVGLAATWHTSKQV